MPDVLSRLRRHIIGCSAACTGYFIKPRDLGTYPWTVDDKKAGLRGFGDWFLEIAEDDDVGRVSA